MSLLFNQIPYQTEHFNELLDQYGQPRMHWSALMQSLQSETDAEMQERVNAVKRQVSENGLTYNVYGDINGLQRPWDLDVIPFILPESEWLAIETAVTQRATLLNHILLDVYGAQSTLINGTLPPELVHGHAGFLRPCHGLKYFDNVALHNYAVDIARAPNGKWWVVADRTQAPTGAGYALENRMIIARTYPDLFRDLNIRRLSGFFANMRDSLSHWGRLCAQKQQLHDSSILPLSQGEQPLIVILTPGPYNETYHEQSFLAGYLGFPLVQGSDLTVRNGMVWLKTISGLKAVHVILRRLDDDFCDPLSFKPDSILGIPGLIESVKRELVVIANSLGSNLLQSGALLGYLPDLCQQFLGEPLKMPSVATWWCGEPKALEYVIANLDNLVIKPAFPQIHDYPIFGEDLNSEKRGLLIEKLCINPQNYIAQEQVNISQTPTWSNEHYPQLHTQSVGLRVYACATPNGYVVMPGGLARVASKKDSRVITMQRGGTSKDTWITSEHFTQSKSLLRSTTSSKDLIRGNTYLSSRMVENLYWYGRYAIRNGQISNLLRLSLRFLLEITPRIRVTEWPTIYQLCTWYDLMPNEMPTSDEETLNLLKIAVFSNTQTSLSSNIQQFFHQAFNLRERLSNDHWRTVNQLSQQFITINQQPTTNETFDYLDSAVKSFSAISGFALDWMTRDEGWQFMSIGRRIERLQFLCNTIKSALTMPEDSNLDWLLQLTNNIVTYRARYSARPEWLPVLDLILLDDKNPNAVIFQLTGLIKYISEISRVHSTFSYEQDLAKCLTKLQSIDVDGAFCHHSETLIDWLEDTYTISEQLSDQLSLRFFSYTDTYKSNFV